jgi:hypothetical protein
VLGRAGLITAVPACALVAAVAHAAVPSDPLTQNAVFEAVGLPRAWDVTTGSEDVVIAVVDSGVDASHPDLAGAVDEGYDFVDGDSGAAPLVAGIAALLRAHAPFATVSQIDSALARTARPVAGVRFGLLDAYAALQALGQPAPRFEPTIEGAADVGETLTAHTGIWAGARIESAYDWQRCRGASCATVGTGVAYRVRSGDRGTALQVSVSAAGVPTAVSARTAVVPERARNERRPSVTGRALVGETLRAGRGSWSGTLLSFSATWIRCRVSGCGGGVEIAHGWRYRARPADRRRRLRVAVTATNLLGSVTAVSITTARIR